MYQLKLISLFFFLSSTLFALTATEIAQKSYNVNHSIFLKNMMIKKRGRSSIIVLSRMPNKKPRITAIERFLSNEFKGKNVEAKDLIVIRSGKLNGMGILMTSYVDERKSHEYLMWLPALRKVRRMAEPKDAGLGAGDIAFLEDAKLRRFYEEEYMLLETKVMNISLKMMAFKANEFGRYTKKLPYKDDVVMKNRKIYLLKSTYKAKEHWYDYRISHIDSESFSDYMTEYYKDEKLIKKVYRHWIDVPSLNDSTKKMWYYWYSIDTQTGYEMLTYAPQKLIKINQKKSKSFWSEKTLRKIKR